MTSTLTTDQLLNLNPWPRRQESVRFDVLNATDFSLRGSLAVDSLAGAPSIQNETAQPIRRSLDGLRIPPRPDVDLGVAMLYLADVNVISDRVRVVWELANGVDTNLGVFLYTEDPRDEHSWGEGTAARLCDQCFILDQPILETIGYPVGSNLGTILSDMATAAGMPTTRQNIEATVVTAQTPMAWPAGRTHRLALMEEVCAQASFLPPYFDNDGTLVCRSAPNVAGSTPDETYTLNSVGRVLADTTVMSSNLLTAPNVYVVIDSSATAGEVVGRYDIPDTAPNSYANRGFYIPKIIDMQGLQDVVAANAAAQLAYSTDKDTLSFVSFTGPPDPRHDTFDVVAFNGVNYLELGWSLELRAGGAHRHNLARVYQ